MQYNEWTIKPDAMNEDSADNDGSASLVCHFEEADGNGEVFLDLDQINTLLRGDPEEVKEAGFNKEALLQARNDFPVPQ